MAEHEIITGVAIPKLFKELLRHKALLKLTLVDSEYEHLTLISDLVIQNNAPHLIIEAPAGLQQAAAGIDSWHLRFEFTGKDHIRYTFSTTEAQLKDKRIYMPCPARIKRWQRRELFRVDAPEGTLLCLTPGTIRGDLTVINISIGGTLAALVQTDSHGFEKAPFTEKQFLEDVELVFPSEIMPAPIRIKTVQIKRIERNSEKTGYEVGFEFNEINIGEEKRLTDLIYRLQRQHLRHRLPLDF